MFENGDMRQVASYSTTSENRNAEFTVYNSLNQDEEYFLLRGTTIKKLKYNEDSGEVEVKNFYVRLKKKIMQDIFWS